METVQELQKEYKNLELLLQGTQRENERCMAEMERSVPFFLPAHTRVRFNTLSYSSITRRRGKTREKMLERELAKLAGENWQVRLFLISVNTYENARTQSTLDITPQSTSLGTRTATGSFHHRSNSQPSSSPGNGESSAEAVHTHVEQVRLLILGMEQRLQLREEKLLQSVQKAEVEASRFEELRRGIVASSS